MAPFDELHLAHATAPALPGPWTKQPFALSTDPAFGETHLWAPHVIEHDGPVLDVLCAGALARPRTGSTWPRPTTAHVGAPPRQPAAGRRVRGAGPDGAAGRGPVGHVLHGHREPAGGNHVVAAAESDDLVHWGGATSSTRTRCRGPARARPSRRSSSSATGASYLFIGPDWEALVRSHGRRAATTRRPTGAPGSSPATTRSIRPAGQVRHHRRPRRRGRRRRGRRLLGEPLRLGTGRRVPGPVVLQVSR